MKNKYYKQFKFESPIEIDDVRCQQITDLLVNKTPLEVFGNRGSVFEAVIPGWGPVAVKTYRRGGLVRFLNPDFHFTLAQARSSLEMQWLLRMQKLDVPVPEVLASVVHGKHFYRCWLVTKLLSRKNTVADLSNRDEALTRSALVTGIKEVSKLIEAKIFHTDLHPGNMILGDDNRVYLIDFDKAQVYRGSKNRLRDAYLCRWRRAVIKHKLPEYLSEIASAELRVNFAG